MTQKNYREIRERYPSFAYHGFELTSSTHGSHNDTPGATVQFHYEIAGLTRLSSEFKFRAKKSDLDSLTPLLYRLGMMEALSYWKATCSPNFSIPKGALTQGELHFWNTLFFDGLSEFRFRNEIDEKSSEFVEFTLSNEGNPPFTHYEELSGNLIPIGGGKDSIVSLNLLENEREENHLFYLNPRPACNRTGEIANYPYSQVSIVERALDSELFRLNKEGYLNGHTPYSALLAFTSLIVSALNKKRYIVLSNEGSASEGNVIGADVNHQYSKSYQFEKLFRDYVAEFLTKDIEYFSLLRPLNELQIGKLFSKATPQFQSFRSCNVGCYDDVWCCECSKCLFTAIVLAPFLSTDELNSIFPKNPLSNSHLSETLLDLILDERTKPFDCVGTKSETRAGLKALLEQGLPYTLLDEIQQDLVSAESLSQLLAHWNSEHFLPSYFEEVLKNPSLFGENNA